MMATQRCGHTLLIQTTRCPQIIRPLADGWVRSRNHSWSKKNGASARVFAAFVRSFPLRLDVFLAWK
jgi:hypothetical protein